MRSHQWFLNLLMYQSHLSVLLKNTNSWAPLQTYEIKNTLEEGPRNLHFNVVSQMLDKY